MLIDSFLPLHWYDVSVDGFKQYVQNFHDKTGHNIWVTEYACQNFNGGAQCSDDQSMFFCSSPSMVANKQPGTSTSRWLLGSISKIGLSDTLPSVL